MPYRSDVWMVREAACRIPRFGTGGQRNVHVGERRESCVDPKETVTRDILTFVVPLHLEYL